VRRRSAGLTAVRATAALTMIVAALGIYGLVSSPVFGLDRVEVSGARLVNEADVRAALAVADGTNLVTLDTRGLVGRLESIPAVAAARVTAALPGTLQVSIDERRPILAWSTASGLYLVDVTGMVISSLPPGAAVPLVDRDGNLVAAGTAGTPTTPAAGSARPLPSVRDTRTTAPTLGVGQTLPTVDLDAARRLGSLKPSDIGSTATGLELSISDGDGFVITPTAGPGTRWTAVFGIYTDTIRPPSIIPGQVRLLAGLLSGREEGVARITLASETDGTYVPAASPKPSASAKPSATP
jgi:cell division protein FtsQ